jgi:signal transduction histidine kinase
VIATIVHDNLSDAPPLESLFRWLPLTFVAIPAAFLIGVLRTRLHHTKLGELAVQLSQQPPPSQLQAALADTLGDPSVQVVFWMPDQQHYIGVEGTPVDLPDGNGRVVTVLDHGIQPTAALIHDPSLLDDPSLVAGATATARLALDNARLHAELLAQLAEVRASRARIVEAGDDERRRLERDLHDGAQQRLLGIRLSLRLARGRLADSGQEAEQLLAEAEAELDSTLEELRALARGIHPSVLTDEGLAAALETLARRAPFAVTIAATPTGRLAAPVEAAAYFVTSEALANVAKHAHASCVTVAVRTTDRQLVVDISDDGVGGANDTVGSGLVGLRDRVEALNGSMRIDSPRGEGTHLHAEIPCP